MKGPRLPRWLYPGMHLKRWLVLAAGRASPSSAWAPRSSSATSTASNAADEIADRVLAHRRLAGAARSARRWSHCSGSVLTGVGHVGADAHRSSRRSSRAATA